MLRCAVTFDARRMFESTLDRIWMKTREKSLNIASAIMYNALIGPYLGGLFFRQFQAAAKALFKLTWDNYLWHLFYPLVCRARKITAEIMAYATHKERLLG